MTLISVHGWDNLLMVNEDEGQLWFQTSKEKKPSQLIHTYTLDELLKEWNPSNRKGH